MDGSHNKETIPLESESYRRTKTNATVHCGQLLFVSGQS